MEHKKTNFLAFIAGHGNKSILTKSVLHDYLQKQVEGFVSLEIPSNVWKGYGFVYVQTQAQLTKLLKTRTMTVKGYQL